MPYIVGYIDGYDGSQFAKLDAIDDAVKAVKALPYTWIAVFDTHSKMDDNVMLDVQVFQKSSSLKPEDLTLKLKWRDTYHGDEVLSIQGTMSNDLDDFSSIASVADATEQFGSFEIFTADTFADYIDKAPSFNAINTLGRNKSTCTLDQDTDKESISGQTLYETLVELDDTPNYLGMFFNNDVQLFQTMVRVSEKLNIPLKVELDPTLMPDQAVQIAEELSAASHRVEIIINAVLSRPNSAQTLRGKKVARYGLGTILGYTILRNANTNAEGIPPLQNPIAGYAFPMRWSGMEMRTDVKFTEEVLNDLAKAKVNVILREKYDTGPRFVVADCLTQYDSKTSVLRLTNSAEISMYIDNRLIQICKRHLLRAKTAFKTDATRECKAFLESCATAGLIVMSEDLGGMYTLSITDRKDRPHDAVDLKAGYRPEGTTRAVYLSTGVYK